MANNKDPKYMAIYEQLLHEIQIGTYLPSQQLPVETQLAEKYGVSRNTLRQAIMMLVQEGYLSNHQGKGTFVLQNFPEDLSSYEKVSNPLKKYSKKEIVKTDVDFDIIKASKDFQAKFNIDASKLLINLKCIYHTEDGPVGFSDAVIPYDLFAESKIPMDNMQAIYDFYLYTLSRNDVKAKCTISLKDYIQNSNDDLFSNNKCYLAIDEIYKDKSLNILISQILYMDPQNYEIQIYKTYN